MSRTMISRALALVALVTALVLRIDSRANGPGKAAGAPAEAASKPTVSPKDKSPADKSPNDKQTGKTEVERALAEAAEFDFKDTPLKDVATFVADHYKINVLLDLKALADAGVTADTPIVERVKGVSLHSALELTLRGKDLSYFGHGENVLLITTADVAKTRVTTKIYDVSNFADSTGEFSSGPKSWNQFSEIVTSTVTPSSWDANGGAGSLVFFDGKMIVTQTDELHQQIDDLFTLLDAARALAAAPGDGKMPVDLVPQSSPEARIERILDSRQDFVFAEVPLGKVAKSLEKQLGITVQLDDKALADAGITADTPMSIKLKQVRAREGLHDLLSPKDLDFIIDHEILLITTSDVGKTKTVTRLYPVKDLVGDSDAANGDTSYDPLVEAITGSVVPAAWDANGGAGSIMAFPLCKVLIISQTQEIHQEIKSLLTMIRASRSKTARAVAVPNVAPAVRIYPLSSVIRVVDDKQGEQFVELIRKLIEPKSWADPNVYIGFAFGSIVVRQTPDVHRRIQALIDALGIVPTAKSAKAAAPAAPAAASGIQGSGFGGGAF